MGKHNIEKNTFMYRILYRYGYWLHNLLYREFVILNKPKKTDNQPNIYTPNHQNALMDALALLFAKNNPLVFLARSDIFKKKTVANILYFLKILPIFRIRDGFDSLKNNQEIFDNTVRVLSSNRGLVILPEGNHEGIKRLRSLKKGFARIAFMTEINGNEKVNLNIVPVSLDYTSYTSFYCRLTVVFGKPFPLKDFLSDYKEKPEVALNKIKNHLSEKLKEHIIHIEHDDYYDEIVSGTAIYAENKHHFETEQRYYTQREAVQKLNEIHESNRSTFDEFGQNVRKIKESTKSIPDEIVGLAPKYSWILSFIMAIFSLPLALPGTILYGFFYQWPKWFTKKKIKDPQFRTSVRYVVYILQFFLINIIGIIVLLCTTSWETTLIVLSAAIASGILGYKIWQVMLWNWHKLNWLLVFKGKKGTDIAKSHKAIISILDGILNKQ